MGCILGDLQKPPGCGPGQPALGGPEGAGLGMGGLQVPSHLSPPVTDPAVCSLSQPPNDLRVNIKKFYHDKPNKEGNVHIFNILQRYLHSGPQNYPLLIS